MNKKTEAVSLTRQVAKKVIPPSPKKCNGRLAKRDGYCEKKGIIEGERCKNHGGALALNKDVSRLFKDALTIEQSAKLETLVSDTMSMTGEIAVQKIDLLESIKDVQKLKKSYHELLNESIPLPRPCEENDEIDNERFKLEMDAWKEATAEKRRMQEDLKAEYEMLNKRVQTMLDQITKSVERNNKITTGKKYTLDIRQLVEVLSVQTTILQNRCMGCPKLSLVANDFKEMKIKGLGNIKDIAHMMRNAPAEVKNQLGERLKEIRESTEFEVADRLNEIDEAEMEIIDNIPEIN